MRRRSVRTAILLSAVAAVAFAAPAVASASDEIPPHCRKHPITGELICDYPKP